MLKMRLNETPLKWSGKSVESGKKRDSSDGTGTLWRTGKGGRKQIRVAGYCRLSKSDGEVVESESIENQKKLIGDYVEKHPELVLSEYFVDDGYSGLCFENRPEFMRMMSLIYAGKLDGVITKDLSRLGRDHIDTSHYVERVFPALGVRYIAILDGVDSEEPGREELAQFKNLMNDMYSRDISRKIKGALRVQRAAGNYVSGFAPYGYKKDPADRHHFLIDEEAAEVVRRIFRLYLEGRSKQEIAELLNEEKILTPTEYKRNRQGLPYANARGEKGGQRWTYLTIHLMLQNRVYTGAMVQHKTEKISYKLGKIRSIPKEEYVVVEGRHLPIIEPHIFDAVQRKNRLRKNRKTDKIETV